MGTRVKRNIRRHWNLPPIAAALFLLAPLILSGCGTVEGFDSLRFWDSDKAPKRSAAAESQAASNPIVLTLNAEDVPGQLGRGDFDESKQQAIVHLSQVAPIFYQRLSHRRVNSIATFHDPALREFFHSSEAFADYYADLVQALDRDHFEANRPTDVGVESFAVEEGGDRVIVRVRFHGDNGLPMRFWSVDYTREDIWEHSGKSWWIIPRKL